MFQVVHRLIPWNCGQSGTSQSHRPTRPVPVHICWRWFELRLGCRMAKKREAVDNLLDALVWMRRKAKKHEPVDALIDELVKMRRKAKKKVAKKKAGVAKKKAGKKRKKKRTKR